MSWYSDFKTGTKDHLVSGKSKKSSSYSSYGKYGKSSWWMDDWDYSPSFAVGSINSISAPFNPSRISVLNQESER